MDETLPVEGLTLHVTVAFPAPPVRVAARAAPVVSPAFTVAGVAETDTARGKTTVTVAVPDLVGSCDEVAVTVTVPAALGAVRTPDELIVPALAVQVTEEL